MAKESATLLLGALTSQWAPSWAETTMCMAVSAASPVCGEQDPLQPGKGRSDTVHQKRAHQRQGGRLLRVRDPGEKIAVEQRVPFGI
jgi:hypothetical protein